VTWIRIDDGILDNPKIAKVGVTGFALYVAGLVFCGRNLSNGFIPKERALLLLPLDAEDLRDSRTISALISQNLWEICEGGYQVHDYLKYNRSRASVLRERASARQRSRRVRANFKRSSHEVQEPDTHPYTERTNAKENPPLSPLTGGELIDLWNVLLPHPPFGQIHPTGKRLAQAKLRVTENPDATFWRALMVKASASRFLRGAGPRGWVMNFDWLVRNDTNAQKVAEGRYDDQSLADRVAAEMGGNGNGAPGVRRGDGVSGGSIRALVHPASEGRGMGIGSAD